MQTGYFSAAWNDIRNSQGWFRKLLLLTLLMFIPVFGWIVLAGYLLGWARDMAWGVHAPMPARLFGNEDGKLYSRGFFAWLIRIVVVAIAWVVFSVATALLGMGESMLGHVGHGMAGISAGVMSLGLALVILAFVVFLAIAGTLFTWVGWMRMSIYGRLSAGFQLGRMWAMLRHDTGGIMRIFGAFCVLNIVVAAALVFLGTLLVLLTGLGIAIGVGVFPDLRAPSLAVWAIILFTLAMAAAAYLAMGVYVFSTMVAVRALGYWTRQFDVPQWRGQDDPMPFEMANGPQAGPQTGPQP